MQRAPFAIPDCPRFAVSTQAYRHLPRFVLRFREGQRTTVEVTEEAVVSQTRKRDGERAVFRVLTDVRSRPDSDPQGRPQAERRLRHIRSQPTQRLSVPMLCQLRAVNGRQSILLPIDRSLRCDHVEVPRHDWHLRRSDL